MSFKLNDHLLRALSCCVAHEIPLEMFWSQFLEIAIKFEHGTLIVAFRQTDNGFEFLDSSSETCWNIKELLSIIGAEGDKKGKRAHVENGNR